jgi:hypothetical protein
LILRDEASRFVIAAPGLRGETLEVDGETHLSGGDRGSRSCQSCRTCRISSASVG